MGPVHTARQHVRYRYYVSRLAAGEDRSAAWRLPAGEIDRLVIDVICGWLLTCAHCSNEETANTVAERISYHRDLALRLPVMATPEQREAIIALNAQVQLRADAVSITLGNQVTLVRETRLVRKGMDLRLALPPGDISLNRVPDPVLLKLVVHAQSAKQLLVDGNPASAVAHYGKRHLRQLLRINWLAPDILSAIVNGTQPVDLTGRRLLRATDIPLDWDAQRRMFGFS